MVAEDHREVHMAEVRQVAQATHEEIPSAQAMAAVATIPEEHHRQDPQEGQAALEEEPTPTPRAGGRDHSR